MGALELIPLVLSVADKILGLVDRADQRKYIDRLRDISLDILDEVAKGYNRDDARLGMLLKKKKIELEALQRDIDSKAS